MSHLRRQEIADNFMVSAGQHLATEAAVAILDAGGNAIDAGVAGAITLAVVHSDQVQFAGVAPMILYLAAQKRAYTISGLGWWPRATRLGDFIKKGKGFIPEDITRTVVPAAPDAYIQALKTFGTMTFSEVAAAGIRHAREGVAVNRIMATFLSDNVDGYRRWPQNAAIYLRDGNPLREGDMLVQEDLARSIQYMADEEKAAAQRDRAAGLDAARDAFYRGDIAQTMVRFHRENGGLLTADDLNDFQSDIEAPVSYPFLGTTVFSCGPWCQGPVLLQMLSLLSKLNIDSLGHNSVDYINTVSQVMDLCFSDRERYFGDPKFVDVPLGTLLSEEYAVARIARLKPREAFRDMPQPGMLAEPYRSRPDIAPMPASAEPGLPGDTSCINVIDRDGNGFACSPSDVSWESPVIPGLGFAPSTRGAQSFAIPGHASCIAAGKRPRLTPNPAMALRGDGAFLMPFSAPGGDMQPQGMLQVLLNHLVFGMDIQTAINAPRFVTRNFPDSFEPHDYYPGRLDIEEGIGQEVGEILAGFGHRVNWLPENSIKTSAVYAVVKANNRLHGGADLRRTGTALGR
ncbi:gamma-glutamyltransferase family protein (plasmid) [Mesorhizobium sp. ORM8.1]